MRSLVRSVGQAELTGPQPRKGRSMRDACQCSSERKVRLAADTSVTAAAALLMAAAALALFGCNRTEHTPNPAPQTVQSAPPSAAAPAGYVYITNNGEGTVSEFSRQADGSLNFLRIAKAGAGNG